jgi:hypothetical protein
MPRHSVADGLDRQIGFVVVELRRFAVRAEHDKTGERRGQVLVDVSRQRARVKTAVRGERRRKRGVNSGELVHPPDFTSDCAGCLLQHVRQQHGDDGDLSHPKRKRPAQDLDFHVRHLVDDARKAVGHFVPLRALVHPEIKTLRNLIHHVGPPVLFVLFNVGFQVSHAVFTKTIA